MINKTLCLATALMLVLAGCSGGGGSNDASANVPPPPSASTPDPAPDSTQTGAAAITVPTGFNFLTSQLAFIEVDLGEEIPYRTYLTVCRPTIDGANPDYSTCLKRTPVFGGSYMSDVEVSNDVDTLVATLWSFEPAEVLRTVVWSRAEGSGAAELRIH